MLVKIIIGIVIVVVVFVVIVAMQPSEATITRSMTMPLLPAPTVKDRVGLVAPGRLAPLSRH